MPRSDSCKSFGSQCFTNQSNPAENEVVHSSFPGGHSSHEKIIVHLSQSTSSENIICPSIPANLQAAEIVTAALKTMDKEEYSTVPLKLNPSNTKWIWIQCSILPLHARKQSPSKVPEFTSRQAVGIGSLELAKMFYMQRLQGLTCK